MAEKAEKKGGAGKFILGAILGGIAGAVAGKFIKFDSDGGEEVEDGCDCGDDCECKKPKVEEKAEKAKKEEAKKPEEKKSSEKK